MAVIMDDNADVWRKEGVHCLLHCKPFIHFRGSSSQWVNMLPSTTRGDNTSGTDRTGPEVEEPDNDGHYLKRCLQILQSIHTQFYDSVNAGASEPCRHSMSSCGAILGQMRRQVLEGCGVVLMDGEVRGDKDKRRLEDRFVELSGTTEEAAETVAMKNEGTWPDSFLRERQYIFPFAENVAALGATVRSHFDTDTTHVVVFGNATPGHTHTLAIPPGVMVVHFDWIKSSGYHLQVKSNSYSRRHTAAVLYRSIFPTLHLDLTLPGLNLKPTKHLTFENTFTANERSRLPSKLCHRDGRSRGCEDTWRQGSTGGGGALGSGRACAGTGAYS